MPLSAVNFVPLTGNIKAVDLRNFFDLFTGAMTDQPVTFANTLQVGGSQGAGVPPIRIVGVPAQTANMIEARALAADVQPIFSVGPTGTLAWGPGAAVGPDVSLRRSAPNQLTLQGLAGAPALVIPVGGLQVSAGNVGIGLAPIASSGLAVSGNMAGTAQYGVNSGLTGSSAATVEITGIVTQPSTAAAVFTCTTLTDFHATNPIKGAGSTITSAYGLLVDAITAGNTNNYGIRISPPSGGTGDNVALSAAGDVIVGGGALGAGLLTNATSGYLFIPTMNGAPTGTPNTTGDHAAHYAMVFDTLNNKLWVWFSGSTWKGVVLA